MPEGFSMFAMPDTGLVLLRVQPRLASWNRGGDPDQVRLEAFLADAYDSCRQQLDALPDPLALRLDVGLPSAIPLLDQRDLDNYLLPLVTRLSRLSGRRFVSVWGTKQHAEASYLTVVRAVPINESAGFGQVFNIQTTASSESAAFKEQIDQQLADAILLPDGPVALHVSFVVGPRRSWPNLWKPTIDALGRLLGRTTPDSLWDPRDGRVVELGLSNRVDPALIHDVNIRITATPVTDEV